LTQGVNNVYNDTNQRRIRWLRIIVYCSSTALPVCVHNVYNDPDQMCMRRYQKQLQLNYVQMYKKNKTLETEIDQVTNIYLKEE